MTKHVAIIDDSGPFCLLVKQLLEPYDCFVEVFHSAEPFLQQIAGHQQFDLVLLDLHLPQMNGLSILLKLKTIPHAADIPVMLLTADGRKDTVIKGKKLGAADFIIKPIDPEQLEQRVIQLLYSVKKDSSDPANNGLIAP